MSKKILLVEDDKMIASMYETKIRNEGFEMIIAENGVQGIDLAVKEKPDLILLDVLGLLTWEVLFWIGKFWLLIETLFLETLIFVSFSVYSNSVRLNSSKQSVNSFIIFLSIFIAQKLLHRNYG